jgi:nicotinate-nucleotide adenylyltransferase
VNPRLPASSPLVLFGGTFDPVHYGHLRVAADVRAALRIDEVSLVPSGDPPHRPAPGASAVDRIAMLELAVTAFPGVRVNAIEVERGGLSYTVETLQSLRREWPERPLAWVVGVDAFLTLPTWHRWQEILVLSHLVVIARPGVAFADKLESGPPEQLQGALATLWQDRHTRDPAALVERTAGSIISLDVSPNDISATTIRRLLATAPQSPALARLLPQPVLAYIESHHLYGTQGLTLHSDAP